MKTLKRRRKSNQTDYAKRIKLLKSGAPRLVFRKTNRYLIAEYVTSIEAQDKVELGMTSKALLKHGWPKDLEGSLKSTPAAYLTGFLFGKEILKRKMDIPIVDLGMSRNQHKNKTFGFLKGLKDSGLDVQCDEEYYPKEDRIKGKHLKKDFSKVFEEIKSKVSK
jgi:large subunit ribosomal protein L18